MGDTSGWTGAAGSGGGSVRLLVLDVAGHRCGVPVDAVVELHPAVEPVRLPDAPAVVAGVVNRRGTLTPVLDVRRRLDLPTRPVALDDHLVVVDLDGRHLALLVDRALDVATVEPEALDAAVAAAAGAARTAGVAVLPDGLLAVVDLSAFVSSAEAAALDRALAAAAAREDGVAATGVNG